VTGILGGGEEEAGEIASDRTDNSLPLQQKFDKAWEGLYICRGWGRVLKIVTRPVVDQSGYQG